MIIATKDVTTAQLTAVVRAANLVESGPFPGHVMGTGRLPKMPATITEADMLSGDPKRTLGWTFVGVRRGKVEITDGTAAAIVAPAKDLPIDAKTLADAQSALTKATATLAGERLIK